MIVTLAYNSMWHILIIRCGIYFRVYRGLVVGICLVPEHFDFPPPPPNDADGVNPPLKFKCV